MSVQSNKQIFYFMKKEITPFDVSFLWMQLLASLRRLLVFKMSLKIKLIGKYFLKYKIVGQSRMYYLPSLFYFGMKRTVQQLSMYYIKLQLIFILFLSPRAV